MADLVEKLRFVASGQDDVHSQAITAAADEIERLRADYTALLHAHHQVCVDAANRAQWLLDIADAARLSPYREANQWDDSLAKLIARRTKFLKA